VSTGTNQWQRVDNTGCLPWVMRVFLLAWSIGLPYAVVTGSTGWFAWCLACVLVGVWLTVRSRNQKAFEIPEMTVELLPEALEPGQQFAVMLRVTGDKGRSIRWWSAEMMAAVSGDDPKPVVSAEFAIDPEAESSPVAQLQMVLDVPNASALREFDAKEWFLRVTVETDHGRMESGKVPVRMVD
jgi:hypothetical protein